MKFRVWDIENKKYLYTPQAVFDALVYPDKYVLEHGFTASIRGEDITIFEGDIFCTNHKSNKKVVRFNNQLGCFEICAPELIDSKYVNNWSGISDGWVK